MPTTFPARIFGIVAREGPNVVLFRRGPSDTTRLITWNTETDEFTLGQWIRAKAYVRRADLSPDGRLLVYFAATHTSTPGRYYSYIAISRPPFFTALALWPKQDSWGGGGLWQGERELLINHRPQEMTLDGHIPKSYSISQGGGGGEDLDIYLPRLNRDGWTSGTPRELGKLHWEVDRFRRPANGRTIEVVRTVCASAGDKKPGEGAYTDSHALRNATTGQTAELPDVAWADWDFRGRLIFARRGKVFAADVSDDLAIAERELIDTNSMSFEPIAPPSWAKQWPQPLARQNEGD